MLTFWRLVLTLASVLQVLGFNATEDWTFNDEEPQTKTENLNDRRDEMSDFERNMIFVGFIAVVLLLVGLYQLCRYSKRLFISKLRIFRNNAQGVDKGPEVPRVPTFRSTGPTIYGPALMYYPSRYSDSPPPPPDILSDLNNEIVHPSRLELISDIPQNIRQNDLTGIEF